MSNYRFFTSIVIVFVVAITSSTLANSIHMEYSNPAHNESWISCTTSISIRYSTEISRIPLKTEMLISGERSGQHTFNASIALDDRTLILKPETAFLVDEMVTVKLLPRVDPVTGDEFQGIDFNFKTVPLELTETMSRHIDEQVWESRYGYPYPEEIEQPVTPIPQRPNSTSLTDLNEVSLPNDFFNYEVTNNPGVSPGYLYMVPVRTQLPRAPFYALIMDNSGDIKYFYREQETSIFHFEPFPDLELMTMFMFSVRYWYVMDLSYNKIDSVQVQNGFTTDSHELLILENGNYLIIGQDRRIVDMSQFVDGGHPEAVVVGGVIQELDANHNVLLNWRSLDHIPIMDMDTTHVNPRGETIDCIHINSIEIDHDENIIISSRITSELTKIDRNTGEVIWRLGGGSGNEFTFIDDNGTYHQHDARRLENGNLMVFDNGQNHHPQLSSSKEYILDEENLTATLTWSYQQDPGSFSLSMGSSRRQQNGNTLIGWGHPGDGQIQVTEVNMAGDLLWKLSIDSVNGSPVSTYRAVRTEMIGEADRPYLWGENHPEAVSLYLNYFADVDIESYDVYFDTAPEPTQVLENVTENYLLYEGLTPWVHHHYRVKAIFTDGSESAFSNELLMLPRPPVSVSETSLTPARLLIPTVYPNPFNSFATVQVNLPKQGFLSLQLYNLVGQEVMTFANSSLSPGLHSWQIDSKTLGSGVYYLKGSLEGVTFHENKVILLK
ncbi:aryl-sulfate sulfotransferase [bacterium]|nr:aryl-sulfate sulfotransferase [bacterium]